LKAESGAAWGAEADKSGIAARGGWARNCVRQYIRKTRAVGPRPAPAGPGDGAAIE